MADEKLVKIFDNINDLQKFAEAKNGAIIALNSSVILAIFGIFGNQISQFPIFMKIYIIQMLVFFLASIVICLVSLIPRFSYIGKNSTSVKNKNYVYFMNLADYKVNRFLFELSGKDKKKKYSKFDKNIAKQTIINAGITRKKFQMSKLAIICILAAIFTPIFVYPIHFLTLKQSNKRK